MSVIKTSLITKEEIKDFQKAVEHELYASHFYLYLASCTQKQGYFGFQKFFEKEAKDELKHYKGIRDILNTFGVEAEMPTIEEVDIDAESPEMLFSEALELEKELQDFYETMAGRSSYRVVQAILPYLEIQRLSVGEYMDILSRMALVEGNKAGMLMIDKELGGE